MLTREGLKIVDLFRKDLFRHYTIKEIMRKISKSSYSWTFNVVKKLNKLDVVSIEKRGNSNLCSINLDNNLTRVYFSFLEEFNANSRKLPKKNIKELIRIIPLSYFTFIIGGSYAQEKTSKKSDLDVVVLVEDGIDTKKILVVLKNKGKLMIPEVHPYVFTKSEFLEMLLDEEVNYGKLLFKNRLIIFGAENYYLIIKEAIKNGFKG